jgi:hypothetical protein
MHCLIPEYSLKSQQFARHHGASSTGGCCGNGLSTYWLGHLRRFEQRLQPHCLSGKHDVLQAGVRF